MVFFLEEEPEEEGNGLTITKCRPRTAKLRILFPVTSQPLPCPAPLSTFISTFTDPNSRKQLYYSVSAGCDRSEWSYLYFFFSFNAYYLTDAYRLSPDESKVGLFVDVEIDGKTDTTGKMRSILWHVSMFDG